MPLVHLGDPSELSAHAGDPSWVTDMQHQDGRWERLAGAPSSLQAQVRMHAEDLISADFLVSLRFRHRGTGECIDATLVVAECMPFLEALVRRQPAR
jgi:hypothetical protein